MREPWRTKPVIFRIVVGAPRENATPARPPARPPTPALIPGVDPKIPWKTIAAVASAGLLGVWLLRPTRPPQTWTEANLRRIRRLEELEEGLRERERKRELTRAGQIGQATETPRRPTERALAAPALDDEVGESSVLDDSDASLSLDDL